MTIAKITDHNAQMLARLLFEYRDKPNIAKVISVVASRYQGLEDARWQLLTERSIETGVGVQLDVIGRIIGQERGTSADDAEYRLRLRARMRANQSSGTVEDILAVFAALLGGYDSLELTQLFPASLILRIDDIPITDTLADLYASFLRDSRFGGVGAQLQTSPTDADNTFTFQISTKTTALYNTAGSTIVVESTEAFRESGYLFFLTGDADQLRVRYTFKTPTTFGGVTTREGTVANQASGSLVTQPTGPVTELSGPIPSLPIVSIATIDATDFPVVGYVAVGPMTSMTRYRIFQYNVITSGTALRNVVDTGVGSESSFLTGQVVALINQNFGQDAETFGGQLSHIIEA